MKGDHITKKLLDAYKRGEISAEIFLRRTLRHLQSSCEICYEEISQWRRAHLRLANAPGLLDAVDEEAVPPTSDHKAAEKDLKALLPLSLPDRERKVDRALSRFRSPLLARALVQEAIGELAHDLEEASNLLDLAFTILEHGRISNFHREVKAHGLGVRAMIYRLRDDLSQAAELFSEARRVAPRHGIVDLVLAGELDEMEGDLRKDLQDFAQAEELLKRALTRYEIMEDLTRQARTFLVLSTVQIYSKRFEEAIADSKRVLELAPTHKAYSVLATHNICLSLAESGRPQEAARCLRDNQERYSDAKGIWRFHDLHFHWLAGKISYLLKQYQQAEVHLTKARDGFVERDPSPYDAILTSFDLALLYDATERYEELAEVTSIISGELVRESLHEEAAVAVTLFVKAATKHVLSEDFVRQVARFVHFSRVDSSLKCEISLEQV